MNFSKVISISGLVASSALLNLSADTANTLLPELDLQVSPRTGWILNDETGILVGSGNATLDFHDREIIIARMALNKLDLSEEQHAKIRLIFTSYAEEGDSLCGEMMRTQETLKRFRDSGSMNVEVPAEIEAQFAVLTEEISILRTEIKQSVLNVLTIEQEEKFYQIQEWLQQRADRRVRT